MLPHLNYFSRSVISLTISSSISLYLENALEPSLCPESLPTRLGSLTCLQRFPTNVLRARCELATSAMHFCSFLPVTVFLTVTILSIPALWNTALIASLQFCCAMNGNNLVLLQSLYLSRIARARSVRYTFTMFGFSSFVLFGTYSI